MNAVQRRDAGVGANDGFKVPECNAAKHCSCTELQQGYSAFITKWVTFLTSQYDRQVFL